MTYQDKNRTIYLFIEKFLKENGKTEFNLLVSHMKYNFGINDERAKDKLLTLKTLGKISYEKEDDKVMICLSE